MKKLMSIFGATLFVFALASCDTPAKDDADKDANKDADKDAPAPADKKDADTK